MRGQNSNPYVRLMSILMTYDSKLTHHSRQLWSESKHECDKWKSYFTMERRCHH